MVSSSPMGEPRRRAASTRPPLALDDYFSTSKILAFPEVLVASRSPEPMRPINIEINPVNICNQSCTWCTYGHLHARRERLDKARIIEVLDDAKALGARSVTWTGGGEPTVYRDLEDVVEYATSLGFKQGMNTNGSRLSRRLVESLLTAFSYVRFSVDAGTPDVYAATHRVKPGDYEDVLANIGRLAAERNRRGSSLVLGFSFLVDTANVHDLANGARRAKAAGVDYFQVKPIVHYDGSNEQFAAASAMWDSIDAHLDEVFDLESDDFRVYVLGHKFDDVQKQEASYGRTYDTCRGNELLASVGADGSVDVCCAFKGEAAWSFGNVNDTRLLEIWNGQQRRVVLGRIDVHRCPPLCKAHEINKVIDYVNRFDAHRDFP